MRRRIVLSSILGGVVLGALLSVAYMGKAATTSSPLTALIYDQVVDEQNTNAFYNKGAQFCEGSSVPVQDSAFSGDSLELGPTTAYDFGAPWTLAAGLTSTSYADGTNCGTNCIRVTFAAHQKIFAFDTRGTTGPRTLAVSFAQPCGQVDGCPGPGGDPNVLGGKATVSGLLNVSLDFPYTSMAICSSAACPEAQPAFAKFWFADPSDPSVTWRIDWAYLRVLRLSQTTWYIIADACDGSQIAGLSKLIGKRTQPKTVFNGYYKIPFFFAAHQ